MSTYENLKQEYLKICKRILKNEISTNEDTLKKYKLDIFEAYNSIIKYLKNINYSNLSEEKIIYIDSEKKYIKEKLIKCMQNLKLDYNFKDEFLEFNNFEKQIININHPISEPKMASKSIEFQKYASGIIPEYDGSPAELVRFIDALELIADNVDTFEGTAIKLIKTKLKGEARNVITSEGTIQEIINTLRKNIKIESTEMVIAKLMNTKSTNKNTNNYIKELDELGSQLKRAYISEGATLTMAEKYATQNVVSSIKSNSFSHEMKTIFNAATVNTVSEALTKYSQVQSEKEKNSMTIMHYGRKRYQNFRGESYRNKNRQFNQNNNNSRGRYKNFNNFNNQRGRFRGRNRNQNINAVQGNFDGPQLNQADNGQLEQGNQ